MDKLKMQTPDLTEQNIERIAELFPSVITEKVGEDGELARAVNFELLRQLLTPEALAGDEAYEFTWVGKKASMVEACRPIRKTLRPCKEESKNWDATENLYIEGDNLDVLKLLQESYLGKVKMIYIDPPYNTGHDFIYRDDFAMTREEWRDESGEYSDEGERLFQNTESNGRFHSDWCSMIYPRLVLARNLLAVDGVIFISIDDNEVGSLRTMCDELFGQMNFIGQIVVKSNPRGSQSEAHLAGLHEYILAYANSIADTTIIGHKLTEEMASEYKHIENGKAFRLLGLRQRGGFWRRSERPNLFFPIYVSPTTGCVSLTRDKTYTVSVTPIQPTTGEEGTWRWSKDKIQAHLNHLVAKEINRDGTVVWDIFQKDFLDRGQERRTKAKSIWDEKEINYQNGTTEIKSLITSGAFDYAKPVYLIKRCIEMLDCNENDLVLDFFSGSATTAHAVMQLNAEDGGRRKFIMVQLPEKCAEDSEAYKAGYENICEIGKERIRRAGEKIKAEGGLAAQDLDTGFRVFKLDDSNMKDVYYSADEYAQSRLDEFISNIKEDRTDIDLLYGCLLEWGLPLSLPHRTELLEGCAVHTVNNGDLIACFDEDIPETVIRAIAEREPLRVVFRDSSFSSSPAKINVEEIFKLLAPATTVKVI